MRKHLAAAALTLLVTLCVLPTSTSAATDATTPNSLPATGSEQTGFKALAPIPGLTDPSTTSVVNAKSLTDFFNNLYKYLIGLAAAFAIIEIIWGGLEISTKDSVSKQSDGRARIQNAIFGLVLVLSPVLVFSVINPSILNLSVDLPTLGTTPVTVGSGAGADATPKLNTDSGCTTVGTSGVLQMATCATNETAQKETTRCGDLGGKVTSLGKSTLTNGTLTSEILMCTWQNMYTFIDVSDTGWIAMVTKRVNTVNNIRPLAVASNDTKNGDSVLQFVATCSNAGMTTCVSDPVLTAEIECTPTPVTPLRGPARKCQQLTLSCRDYNAAQAGLLSLCSRSPSWDPFH